MVKGNTLILKKELSTRESGSMECDMDKARSPTKMGLSTKDSGKEG
jgi:hypothetical protein